MQLPSTASNRWGVAGLACLAVGFLVLWSTTATFDIWAVVAGVVLTTAGVVLAVGWIGDAFTAAARARPSTGTRPAHQRWAWLAGAVGLATSAGLLWLAERLDEPVIALVGVIAALFSLAPSSYFFGELVATHPTWAIAVGLAATVAGPVAVVLGAVSIATGVVLFVFGLSAYQLGLGTRLDAAAAGHADAPSRATANTVVAATVAFAVGAVLVVVGIIGSGVGAPAAGAYLIAVSMVTLSVALPRVRPAPPDLRVAGPVGALLVLFGGALLFRSGLTTSEVGVGFAVAIVLGLVGAFVVWRGESVFVVVLLGVVAVSGTVDRSVAGPPEVGAGPVLAALGDSYISGEGAPRFYAGTDRKAGAEAPRNECRRAPTAYPVRVAEASAHDLDLLFLACSGARMRNIVGVGDVEAVGQYDEAPQLTQLVEQLRSWAEVPAGDRPELAAVVVSIGGNDARFGDVGKGCILPGTCTEQREIWLQNVETLGLDLEATYRTIRTTLRDAGADVPVLVVPYPLVLTEDGCDASPLRRDEHEFLVEFITVLNDQIRASAARAGVRFVEEAMFAFDGARICEGDAEAMNLVGLQVTDGDLLEQLDPGNWVHNSMHPTPDGHRRMAEVLGPHLDDLLGRIAAGDAPVNPAEVPDVAEVLGIRTVAPTLVDPDEELVGRLLDTFGDQPAPDRASLAFAARTIVFDEQRDADDDPPVVRLSLPTADPTRPLRYTDEAGDWIVAGPDDPTVDVDDGQVTVTLRAPTVGDTRWVLVDDGTDVRLRGFRFCSADPDCPDDFGAWQADQLASAARTAAPTVFLLVFGGWLAALRWRLDDWWRARRGGGAAWHRVEV